jgi:pentachlorophenol monooxygenase/3-(3-hydroxy-phenyl)propionate hydroxylase
VTVPDRPDLDRLRRLARDGITVLLGDDVAAGRVALPPGVPVAVHRIRDLDGGGLLAATLGARADEAWVLRPDGHVAAVVPDPTGVGPAISRTLARPPVG